MGQTLTHGIYLPDEGERNCYNGLAGNWQLLDGAVGTIAEHTTQIAGKANAVHTHTKSDITDFPAYGNAAGTICEGNDSRLSDARTPVAHTHGKADITDLFNSVNTWSGKNTFSDLNPIILKNSNIEKGVRPTDFQAQSVLFKDKNDSNVAYIRHLVNKSGTTNFNADGLEFSIANKFANSTLDPTGTNTTGTFRIGFWDDGQKYIYNEFRWRSSLIPFNNQTQDIGTSTNQWNNLYAKKVNTQSVNSINPGALSLPSETASSVNLDPTNWNITGTTANRYTPPADGWLGVQVMSKDTADLTGQYLFVGRASGGSDYYPEGGTTSINVNSGQGTLMGQVFIPVISGKEYHIRVKIGVDLTNGSSITARFYTCLGNV